MTIAHFRILAKIGEGGMGIVYKAEDERLHRPVALKVLQGGSGGGEVWRLRLIREARTAAAVNHPNIAAIYEIDEVEGVTFIAMEYVEGKTLRSLLGGRPLPIKEALRIATAITAGLARAHQARIIHRDLKPENVAIASDGQVKILDFGLAKLLESPTEAKPSELSRTETLSDERTREGRIVGTAAYMSPEQARGQELDARSDVFSFGIVLYELVTGLTPFKGSTTVDTLTAIIRETPVPAIERNREVPPELQRILAKCLEKDPAERYQDTRDLVVDLRHLMRDSDSRPQRRLEDSGAGIRPAGRRSLPWLVIPLAAAMIIPGAVLAWLVWHRPNEGSGPAREKEIRQRALTASPAENLQNSAVISPDGKYLAYSDRTGLYLLSIDTGETRALPLAPLDPSNVSVSCWFPDGTRLALASRDRPGRSVWSYSIMSGAARKLREGADDPTVSPDGTQIVFSVHPQYREIWVMGSDGDAPSRLLKGDERREEYLQYPQWSPDGSRILYWRLARGKFGAWDSALESTDAQGRETTVLVPHCDPDFCGACWLSGQRLVFSRDEWEPLPRATLWELRVDGSGRPSGEPRKILSSTGYVNGQMSSSSDGRRFVHHRLNWQRDIYVGALDDGGGRLREPRRLTLDERSDSLGGWSREGDSVLFSSNRNGTSDLFKQDLRSVTAELVFGGPDDETDPFLSPDGRSILFWQTPADQRDKWLPGRLMRLPVSGGPPEKVFEPAADRLEGAYYRAECDQSACVLSELIEGIGPKQLVLFALDPEKGRGRELARIEIIGTQVTWDLSPDGRSVAIAEYGKGLSVLSLSDGTLRHIPIPEKGTVYSVSWSRSGGRLFVAGWLDGVLSSITPAGQITELWQWPLRIKNPVSSPDGHHIALEVVTQETNAWLIEDL